MSEELARRFHDLYEQLAPQFGYETRIDTRSFDPESKNGKLMIAVCEPIATELRNLNEQLATSVKSWIEMNRILHEIRTTLYGQGFEVLGWHQNGDTEPLDSWFEDNDGWLEGE